ncbi:hypothetical protein FRC05_008474 [Tulasnella sp. 425]|nr:hypothetical protein FRC05_008474 [Tulasnella sp. 425]
MPARKPVTPSNEGGRPLPPTTSINFDLEVSRLQTFSPPPAPPAYGARARPQSRTATRTPVRVPASAGLPSSAGNRYPVIHMPVPKTPEQTSPVSPLLQYQETGTRPLTTVTPAYDYGYPAYNPPDNQTYQRPGYFAYDAYDQHRYSNTYQMAVSPGDAVGADLGEGDRSYDSMIVPQTTYNHVRGDDPFEEYAGSQEGTLYNPEDERIEKMEAQYSDEKVRYGVPPEEPTARRRTRLKKKVVLTDGNLVVDLPVPSHLRIGIMNPMDEMKTVRYTAVTCDADDFEAERYSLRQNWSGRDTELLIAITMYNEDEILLTRTLYGVMQGISHLCSRKNSKTWGDGAWKKVVVCIISDGRKNIHPRVLDCLAALGVYQDGVMKSRMKDKDVTAHVFEYTTTFGLDPDLKFKYPDKGVVPTQIIFCLKEKNAKKINSHRWFFNAFGRLLQPNVCVLLDVGTRPGVKSLYHIWKAFDVNSNVAGACGEIAAYKGRYWSALHNPLVAAQNFEYKMSNILDKPWESVCGYISVLPGAFSAYRYIALQNDRNGVGPLASYFKGEVLSGADADIFTSNMYLAEDRILCFELVAKAKASWVLKYVQSAVGETDVPDSLAEFIAQRRRWLNGSLFAATYALVHLPQILRSGHGSFRKCVLVFEALFNLVALVFAWFGIANYYLFFVILTSAIEDPVFKIPTIRYFNYIFHFSYAATLASVFVLAMGNKPKASQWKYKVVTIFFSLLTVYMVGCAIVCTVRAAQNLQDQLFVRMIVSIASTYGIYFAASFMALDPWHMFTSFIPYIILSPMYLNILTIYAFCNLDDISWGTKDDGKVDDLGTVKEADPGMVELEIVAEPGDVNTAYLEALNNIKTRRPFLGDIKRAQSQGEKEQATKDYYASVRTNVLLSWILTNGLLMVFILSGDSLKSTFSDAAQSSKTRVYMTFILVFVAATSSVKMDDGLILNIDLDYTKPKKSGNNSAKSAESPSTAPPVRQKQSRPLHISRDEESGPPRKRQRVLSSLKPKTPQTWPSTVPVATPPQASKDQDGPQPSRPTGPVISSLFTSNPIVELPSVPLAPTKPQAPSNAPLKDDSTFEGLGLNPLLTAHLRERMNIVKPTSVQRASLSAILHQSPSDRRDLFIQSQTGSGKTLSFLLPIIHDLLPLSSLSYIDRSVGTLAIIVAPTRELAQQISEVLNTLLQMRLREANSDASEADLGPRLTRWLVSGLLVGGGTRTHDKARLRKGLPILVATPGRLLDHLQNTESFKVAKCRWLVLDEADRLMELGFQDTLEGIIKALDGRRNLALAAAKNGDTFGGEVIGGWNWGPRRQTILCSATMREDVEKLAGTTLHDPLIIKGVANELGSSVKAHATRSSTNTSAPEQPTPDFTPPSQLSQKYLVVPLKLRLVSLVALIRAILTQAQRSPTAGNKIIVFFSCTDSVDFHWELLRGAAMDEDDNEESSQSAGEDEKEPAAPVKIPVLARSAFLPNTSIFRLHGSLPLPARQASVKGFSMTSTSKPAKSPSSNSKPKLEMSVLFCTSVASRGLDLPLVRAVVQYDLPTEGGATEYVHRVGRTARVGKGGESWAFVAPEEVEWVKWVEEGMQGENAEDREGEVSAAGQKASAGKLVPVDYEKILLSGFGGSSRGEAGQRATDIQLAFERWVLRDKSHSALAQKGFQSHMRAYATHPSNEKHIFHVRNLHIGHLAKAFALREAPSNIKGTPSQSSASGPKQAVAPQTERMKAKAKYIPGNSKDATGANSIAPRASKVKERSKKKLTVAERMQVVMKTQGKLTKKDGHIVSGGGADEFQVAGADALERLAR